MPLVFKTLEGSSDRIEIVGVGVLGPNAKGGVAVSLAAQTLPELQDANGRPLTGSALVSGAKSFAESRGFETVNLDEEAINGLPAELGYPVSPLLPAGEQAVAEYKAIYGDTEETKAETSKKLDDSKKSSGKE